MAPRSRVKTKNELRCPACPRQPLLAVYGIDDKDRLYLHVKVYKQSRIFCEIIAYGDISLRCRECNRWHSLHISNQQVEFKIPEIPEVQ